jgi:hypothetical protein
VAFLNSVLILLEAVSSRSKIAHNVVGATVRMIHSYMLCRAFIANEWSGVVYRSANSFDLWSWKCVMVQKLYKVSQNVGL